MTTTTMTPAMTPARTRAGSRPRSRARLGWFRSLPVRDHRLWDGRYSLVRFIPSRYGPLPAWGFQCAPTGLATRRQLRSHGLCPGGHRPYGLLIWGKGDAWAWLYRVDLARPKRVPSAAQLAALAKATTVRLAILAAARWCPECDADAGYPVARFGGICYEHRLQAAGRPGERRAA